MNDPRDDAEFDPFANDPKSRKKQGSGNGVAWLALVLALAVLGFNAWDWWSLRVAGEAGSEQAQLVDSVSRRQAGLENTLNGLQTRIDELAGRDPGSELAALRTTQENLQSRLSALGVADADRQAQIDAINASVLALLARIEAVEAGIAALAVSNDGAGKSLDIAEIDYLLRLADERLLLFADLNGAESALSLADQQLAAIGDPLYAPVRRSIAGALDSLRAVPRLDTVAVGQRLASLQSSIQRWPFPGEAPVAEPLPEPADTGMWARIKSALAPLVKVRRRVDESELLSLEDKDFIRQGLWLQFETARLALIRNDQAGWNQALGRAEETLSTRFDDIEPAVQQAVTTVRELSAIDLVPELPEIRAPLSQLRLLRQSGRGASTTPPAQEPDTQVEEPEADTGEDG